MERSLDNESGARFIWEEDEEGNLESGIRLVRDAKSKKHEVPFPKLGEPLASKVRVEEEAEQMALQALGEARKTAAEAAKTARPDTMVFGSQLEDGADDERDQLVVLTDSKGQPLERTVLAGGMLEQRNATLADYFPLLGKMKIHIRHQIAGPFTGVRLEKVDKENVLWVPNDISHDRVPALIPAIILEVVKASLGAETEKVQKCKEAVAAKVKRLPAEHSTAHRIHALHGVEHKLVAAESARQHKLEAEIRAILGRVMDEQHIDLAAPAGGTEAWLATLRLASEKSMAPGKDSGLVFGNQHAAEGRWAKLYQKALPYSIAADKKTVAAKYDQLQKEADDLPDGLVNYFLKSPPRNALRSTARAIETSLQLPKHLALKPTLYVGAGIFGIFKSLWGLTELPGFKGAKEEIKNWGKWIASPITDLFDTGAKKGGGGGDDH